MKKGKGILIKLIFIGIIVLSISYFLMGPRPCGNIERINKRAALAQLILFSEALESFKAYTGRYPSQAEGLEALRQKPIELANWNGPYLSKEIPFDPWGKAYIYRSPGKDSPYEIISYGADGQPGGKGNDEDIVFVPGKEWIEK